jgi:hypothetical protein
MIEESCRLNPDRIQLTDFLPHWRIMVRASVRTA